MTMLRRFAEGTTVTVDSSRAEISRILEKHGVIRQAWASEPERDTLQFELAGHLYRFTIDRPTAKALWEQWKVDGRSTKYLPNDNQVQAEWRRRWRANVMLLKAKLEFADGQASTITRELMPYAVLTSGQTLEEAILSDSSSVKLLAAHTG